MPRPHRPARHHHHEPPAGHAPHDHQRHHEYHLDLGAEAFRRALEAIGVGEPIVRFELFPGAHGGIEWRYPEAIGWLTERLQP